ncbi:MAG: NUDIX hydrolase [Clostridia bacterium]|nr:NUDIX hydrolase [Clostridia bacterium]
MNETNDAALVEKQVSSELIFDGVVVHLFRDRIELPDGKPSAREVIRHVGAVAVVPLTDDDEVVCVRQFRYPMGKVLLEIPAGKLDGKGEDHAEAALRELREETGAQCEQLIDLGPLYPTPAYTDEVIDLYLAKGLTFGNTAPDEDEFLDVVRVPLAELVDMILRGEIADSKTQAAILKVWVMKCRAEGKPC